MRNWLARVGLVAYLGLLFFLTLVEFPIADPDWNLVPLKTIIHDVRNGGSEFVVNFLGNVAATVPFGFLVPRVFDRLDWSSRRVAAASFGLSLGIELAQVGSRRRVGDVDDLILNTLGGLLGFAILQLGRWVAIKMRSGLHIRGALPGGSKKTRPPDSL